MSKSPRHISRCLALQAIYHERVNPHTVSGIKEYLNSTNEKLYKVANQELLDFLIREGNTHFDEMLNLYLPYLNRELGDIGLVEKSILVIAAVELTQNLNIPATIIINEAIELSKTYGSNDSYKFINSLVDKLAIKLRGNELNPNHPKK